jgi:trans-aconitate methyltransferase
MSELFELSEQYAEMLEQGIRLSGENQDFFIEGRLRHLTQVLPAGFRPRRVLDFGCGVGHTAPFLAETFPQADITGVDTAENALAWAATKYGSPRISFCRLAELGRRAPFDLCYTNGVFHHIEPAARPEALRLIRGVLRPGGVFALFENNPWNPGARVVMSRIPFDRGAKPISPPAAKQMLRSAGFARCAAVRTLFYFPRAVALLRPAERWLARLPLGAQYCILAFRD